MVVALLVMMAGRQHSECNEISIYRNSGLEYVEWLSDTKVVCIWKNSRTAL